MNAFGFRIGLRLVHCGLAGAVAAATFALGACTLVNPPEEGSSIAASGGASGSTAGTGPVGGSGTLGTNDPNTVGVSGTGLGGVLQVDASVAVASSSGEGTGAQFGPQPSADFTSCGESQGATSSSGSVTSTVPTVSPTPGPFFGSSTPVFGTSVTAAVPPPPISGGTLIALRSGSVAVASDPDRDAIYVVDTSGGTLLNTIALQSGDEPGRLVEDGAGRVHVALRSGGALVTIDPTSGSVLERRSVCPAPRGVAWDATTDLVWVACATGELVTLPAAGGAIVTTRFIERDLRDVLIKNGAVSVTTFRSAQILRLAANGSITRRDSIQPNGASAPHVAWRAMQSTLGTFVFHQDESTVTIPTEIPGGYGNGQGVVTSSCAVIDDTTGVEVSTDSLSNSVLPVDFAISPDASSVVVVLAGNGFSSSLFELQSLLISNFISPSPPSTTGTGIVTSGGAVSPPSLPFDGGPQFVPEQLIAVAFDAQGRLLVQSREPAVLHILDATTINFGMTNPLGGTQVVLSTTSRDDTGHDIFHTTAGAAIACASCHPEGGDDGHVWILDGFARRTPSLRGTIAGTAPYHWPGDQPDFPTLTSDVYTGRMGGQKLATDQEGALSSWVQSIPAPPAPSWVDPSAASRGKALFASTGCTSCHSGTKLTNNQTVNVGTCGSFQVPPLVGVGWRAPFFHNGCAASFADRFGKCATAAHGSIQTLQAAEVSDLTAYLESL
jgi:cytochrome c553